MSRRPTRPSSTFYARDPVTVARELLGLLLVSERDDRRTSGRIVETEAYLGEPDKAAHTYGGRRTERNATMWGPPGRAYVYFVYGMHHCVNVVAGREGEPVAVLVRALEPVEGLEVMHERRARARRARDLCSGPAKLCQALAVDRGDDGADLVAGTRLWIERSPVRRPRAARIACGPRVGIDYAEEWRDEPLRFWIEDNPHVSGPRR